MSAAESARWLLLDIGNSRLKWALLQGAYVRGRRFAAQGALDLTRPRGRAALGRLFELAGPAAGIVVCNVAGSSFERRLRAMARAAGVGALHFVRSTHAAGGVRNAYAEPWRLGVDRWAALIGARAEYPQRPLCLVAVGTAMTIDLLDERGRHRGGSIIPGPTLMVDSLLERTAGIQRRAGGRRAANSAVARGRVTLFARDTRSAVADGAVNAAAALVTETARAARALLGRTPLLIVAGGGADAVARQLRVRHRRQDDLVLRGLAVLHTARGDFE